MDPNLLRQIEDITREMEGIRLEATANMLRPIQQARLIDLGEKLRSLQGLRITIPRARARAGAGAGAGAEEPVPEPEITPGPVPEPEITPIVSPQRRYESSPISPIQIKDFAEIRDRANKCLAELASLQRQYDELQAKIDKRRAITEEKLRYAYEEWKLRSGQRGPNVQYRQSIYDNSGIMSILTKWDRNMLNYYLASALNKGNGSPKKSSRFDPFPFEED
jgi:hypothetical protein